MTDFLFFSDIAVLARFIDFSLRDTHTQNALFLGLIHLKQRHPWYATIRSRRFISNRFVLSKGFYFYPDTLRGFFCPLPFIQNEPVALQRSVFPRPVNYIRVETFQFTVNVMRSIKTTRRPETPLGLNVIKSVLLSTQICEIIQYKNRILQCK